MQYFRVRRVVRYSASELADVNGRRSHKLPAHPIGSYTGACDDGEH